MSTPNLKRNTSWAEEEYRRIHKIGKVIEDERFSDPEPGFVEVRVYRSKIYADPRLIEFEGQSFGIDKDAAYQFARDSMKLYLVAVCFKYVTSKLSGEKIVWKTCKGKIAVVSESF